MGAMAPMNFRNCGNFHSSVGRSDCEPMFVPIDSKCAVCRRRSLSLYPGSSVQGAAEGSDDTADSISM